MPPSRKPEPFWVRLYIPALLAGMKNTMRRMFRALVHGEVVTVSYPEEKPPLPENFRGEHVLKKDEHGRVKCVACFLCATACPSECITIVAAPAPAGWSDREKVPAVFDINMLRCIFCGYCEEACPCDAIELTPKPYTVYTSREDAIYHKEKLLNNS